MSRIGRQPIPVPSGVTVTIEPELVTVKGPNGELSERISRDITVEQTAATAATSWSFPVRPIVASIVPCTA